MFKTCMYKAHISLCVVRLKARTGSSEKCTNAAAADSRSSSVRILYVHIKTGNLKWELMQYKRERAEGATEIKV